MLSKSTLKPGRNSSLKVSSYLGSTVSLLAIDQSSFFYIYSFFLTLTFYCLLGVLLLKSGNEFTKEEVLSDLTKYNNLENFIYWQIPEDEREFEVRNNNWTIYKVLYGGVSYKSFFGNF